MATALDPGGYGAGVRAVRSVSGIWHPPQRLPVQRAPCIKHMGSGRLIRQPGSAALGEHDVGISAARPIAHRHTASPETLPTPAPEGGYAPRCPDAQCLLSLMLIPYRMTGRPPVPRGTLTAHGSEGRAVELDRVVPQSGNLWMAGQQTGWGPRWPGVLSGCGLASTGCTCCWTAYRVKPLPSRLDARDLAHLASGRCQPGRTAAAAPGIRRRDRGRADRECLGQPQPGNYVISAGLPLAGQPMTLWLDGPVAHNLSGGTLARAIACTVPQEARLRLRGHAQEKPSRRDCPSRWSSRDESPCAR